MTPLALLLLAGSLATLSSAAPRPIQDGHTPRRPWDDEELWRGWSGEGEVAVGQERLGEGVEWREMDEGDAVLGEAEMVGGVDWRELDGDDALT
ncbi:hypothetical protein HDU67_008880, partial [Dinochytrium kinnereticum]